MTQSTPKRLSVSAMVVFCFLSLILWQCAAQPKSAEPIVAPLQTKKSNDVKSTQWHDVEVNDIADIADIEDLMTAGSLLGGPDTIPLDSNEERTLIALADSIDFSVFDLPMVVNDRVLQEIRYLTKGARKFTQMALNRKTMFQDMVDSALAAKGMPRDLAFLAMVESGYNYKAYSPAAASGIWQFIPATGRRYKLRIDQWVDQRRVPELSTKAALEYLSDINEEFDDWLLSMSGYNCGEGRVRKDIIRSGSRNFWEMPLPKETRHYAPRILAAAIIGRNPEKYGFKITPMTRPLYDTVTVNRPIALSLVAELTNSNLTDITDFNPELIRKVTPPNEDFWTLKIPKGSRDLFLQKYTSLDKSIVRQYIIHKARKGENLKEIASTFGVSLSDLLSTNGLKKTKLKAGQTIRIPYVVAGAIKAGFKDSTLSNNNNTLAPQDSLDQDSTVSTDSTIIDSKSEKKAHKAEIITQTSPKSTLVPNEKRASETLKTSEIKKENTTKKEENTQKNIQPKWQKVSAQYKVKKGETLYSIAKKYHIDSHEFMIRCGLKMPKVKAGQTLKFYILEENQVDEEENIPVAKSKKKSENLSSQLKKNYYVVKSGENLNKVAQKLNVDLEQLLEWNDLKRKSKIFKGNRLVYYKIQSSKTSESVRTENDSEMAKSKKNKDVKDKSTADEVEKSTTKSKNEKTSSKKSTKNIYIVVEKGQTLYGIAKEHQVNIADLVRWNKLNGRGIETGMKLKIQELKDE